MKKSKIAFRVDASRVIGTGHLFRCLTLADFLFARGADAVFVSRNISDDLAQMVRRRGYQLFMLETPEYSAGNGDLAHSAWLGNVSQEVDAEQTASILARMGCDWIVVDHYALDIRWEGRLRACTSNILVIDDLADRIHDCDLLLDQNLFENANDRYAGKVPAHARLLCGPEYALLRDEYRQRRETPRKNHAEAGKILVFFGGADVDNWTKCALDALVSLQRPFGSVDVVVGGLYAGVESLRQFCESHGFRLHSQITNMAELLTSVDLVIGAGGTSMWERCCLGVPSFTLPIASNQTMVVQEAARVGAIYSPDLKDQRSSDFARHMECLIDNPNLLIHMARQGMKLVDGLGAVRVARAMGSYSVSIRPAGPADSARLLAWRNHPSVRMASRSIEPIDSETHDTWYARALSDPLRHLLVGEVSDNAVGVVRFDQNAENQSAEVSIYLDPDEQRKGYGTEVLLAAEEWIRANQKDIRVINAEILDGNIASHRMFHAAGYARCSAFYSKRVAQ